MKLSKERAVAFISHLTGHGSSMIEAELKTEGKEGNFQCVLGHQLYSISLVEFGKYMMLFHSFRGGSTQLTYFHAEDFTLAHEKNEELEEARKEEIIESYREMIESQ